jgi:hypothetical protein
MERGGERGRREGGGGGEREREREEKERKRGRERKGARKGREVCVFVCV